MPRPFRFVAVLFALALAAAALPLAWSSADAAPHDGIYRPVEGFKPTGSQVRVRPAHYAAVRVDTAQVRSAVLRWRAPAARRSSRSRRPPAAPSASRSSAPS